MNKYENILKQLKDDIGNEYDFYKEEDTGIGIFILPFRDSMGDNFVIRIRDNDVDYVIDDGGIVKHNLFVISETTGGTRAENLALALPRSFAADFNTVEGVIEMKSKYEELVGKVLHFTKMLVTLDTMLAEIANEERRMARPERRSLGPRAARKIRMPLSPLVRAGRITPKYRVDGKAVPDWIVDLAYEPEIEYLGIQLEMIIIIAVDLAVVDPIPKAADAFARAIDINSAHPDYGIRVAYDTHGQNDSAAYAASFLAEHQTDKAAYTTIDLSQSKQFQQFLWQINHETGERLILPKI